MASYNRWGYLYMTAASLESDSTETSTELDNEPDKYYLEVPIEVSSQDNESPTFNDNFSVSDIEYSDDEVSSFGYDEDCKFSSDEYSEYENVKVKEQKAAAAALAKAKEEEAIEADYKEQQRQMRIVEREEQRKREEMSDKLYDDLVASEKARKERLALYFKRIEEIENMDWTFDWQKTMDAKRNVTATITKEQDSESKNEVDETSNSLKEISEENIKEENIKEENDSTVSKENIKGRMSNNSEENLEENVKAENDLFINNENDDTNSSIKESSEDDDSIFSNESVDLSRFMKVSEINNEENDSDSSTENFEIGRRSDVNINEMNIQSDSFYKESEINNEEENFEKSNNLPNLEQEVIKDEERINENEEDFENNSISKENEITNKEDSVKNSNLLKEFDNLSNVRETNKNNIEKSNSIEETNTDICSEKENVYEGTEENDDNNEENNVDDDNVKDSKDDNDVIENVDNEVDVFSLDESSDCIKENDMIVNNVGYEEELLDDNDIVYYTGENSCMKENDVIITKDNYDEELNCNNEQHIYITGEGSDCVKEDDIIVDEYDEEGEVISESDIFTKAERKNCIKENDMEIGNDEYIAGVYDDDSESSFIPIESGERELSNEETISISINDDNNTDNDATDNEENDDLIMDIRKVKNNINNKIRALINNNDDDDDDTNGLEEEENNCLEITNDLVRDHIDDGILPKVVVIKNEENEITDNKSNNNFILF